MRHGPIVRSILLLAVLFSSGPALPIQAQTSRPNAQADEPDDKSKLEAEEQRERAVADRFRRVLETNPRRGTALDRLYGYHVERGTLDQLVDEYVARTKKDPKDGTAWLIVGLLESQRGRDAVSVKAFQQAETNLPENALASYYLGQSLILVGQPEPAAAAFERTITRKPVRNDLLDAFQALGRVYQRSQQTEKALEVWNRLEKLFPDDVRVQEQIASTLVEEGQFAQALPRLTKMADQADDKYRQTALRMDAADLKVKLKKSTEAIADFEKLLGDLNPESWLYRDVRRRVEEVFLRNDDLAGLAKYYEKWLDKNKTDVDAIARLAKTLASQDRAREARDWLSKGVAVAPNNRALRQALIDQFVFEQNYVAAAQQYEALDKADPNNPDTLRDWGKLLMRDGAKPETERRTAASRIWRRLVDKKPNDPIVASQTADLLRIAGAADDAVALYKKAIELAPNAAQYREYLGEYFHSLKRSEEALATWRPIAEGANRTSKNLSRLAEVFAGFGYRKEAIAAMADAISLEKDDFGMLTAYAELLHHDGKNDEALKQLAAAGKLSSNPEESEQILLAQIKVFQAMEALGAQIDSLQAELDGGKDVSAERWLRLARYYEANRQLDKAVQSIITAQAKDPKSIPALVASARLYEAAGNLLAAADTNRKLAVLDRRYRTEYLTAVTRLEQRLGRRDQALQAARDLLAASPGNPDVYKFFADLCFQLGDQEEGLEALRRSVRANPTDPQGLITLANALGERVRQGEAIELLWRAFDRTTELDAKLGVVERIAQLYLENNQFDRLLERLERDRREADRAREATLCIAQAYTTAGDLGAARQQLERLITENTRDLHLLGQLSSLCEQEGDLAAAVKYQRQLLAAAPGNSDHQLRLATLLTRSGEPDEAADIWIALISKETEPHKNLTSIDNLLGAGKNDSALAILARMLAQRPGNWELLYREGIALAAADKRSDANVRFSAILGLKLPDDELSEVVKYQLAQARKKPLVAAQPTTNRAAALANRYDDSAIPPLMRRTGNLYRIRTATGVGLDSRIVVRSGAQPVYTPTDFGEARMACLGWLYEFATTKGTGNEYVKQLRVAAEKAGADPRALWDWYYLNQLRNDGKQTLACAITLARGADPAGTLAYLNAVESRMNSNARTRVRSVRGAGIAGDSTPALTPEQLELLKQAFTKLKQSRPTWASRAGTTLMRELKRAGKPAEEKMLYDDMLKQAKSVTEVVSALNVASERNDLDACFDLFNRLDKLQTPAKTSAVLAQLPTRQTASTLANLMAKRANANQLEDVRKIADLYLTTARRQNLTTIRSTSTARRPQSALLNLNIISRTGSGSRAQISYPSPNEYYDAGSISILYSAFDHHKKADLLSDLFAHYEKRRESAQGAESIYLQLALGYLHWWIGEKDEAIAELNRAVQAAPSDHNLLLEVVSLRELNNDFIGAMTLLDSFTPLDMPTMQRREETALRLAERTGDIDRARKAADRLFGLRLDSDKQLELAGKMHRLGMHELAETVLGRAQRQAGNKTATLVRLMMQYQSQNQLDLAVQLARQVLRKGPSLQSTNRLPGLGTEIDASRVQAINVLARSGQLKEIIERTEAQLKASPKSGQIYQALVSYYQAAGDKKKMRETLLKLADLKPKDGNVRFQVAQELQQLGDRDAALEQYKLAVRLEPALFARNPYQIENLFAQANKYDELVQLYDETDLRKFGDYSSIANIISSLLQPRGGADRNQGKNQQLGLRLFRKAWEAYPQNRGYIMSQIRNEELWKLPEIYQFVKEAVIPREDSEGDPWQMALEYDSIGNNGRREGILTRMLAIARKQQRLAELRGEIAAGLQMKPEWTAGKLLLAVIDVQLGDKEKGKQEWNEVFNDPKADVPGIARFLYCQELEFYAGVEDLAVKVMEGGVEEVLREDNNDFNSNTARRLIWWYEQLGRPEDAKKLLLRIANLELENPGYAGGYWESRRVQNKLSIAQELVQAGDPVEAVRTFNKLLSEPEVLEAANQYYGGERFDQLVDDGLRSAIKALKPESMPSILDTLITAAPGKSKDRPVLDLVMQVDSRELNKASISSLFASAIKSTEKAPEVRRSALKKLADLANAYPDDFSVLTANVLAAVADNNPPDINRAVDRLVKLVDSTPLDRLPATGKPNARQKAEAKLQLPIWLAARECLAKNREQLWPAGEKLAARTIVALKRQPDGPMTGAIYREWGQLELDRGFKEKAEAHWNELLNARLMKKAALKPDEAGQASPPAAAPMPGSPSTPKPTPRRGRAPTSLRAAAIHVLVALQQPPTPPAGRRVVPASGRVGRGQTAPPTAQRNYPLALTDEQFKQAYEIALLAIDKQMPELAMRAMSEAVRGGPPVVVTADTQLRGRSGRLTQRVINGTQYYVRGGDERRVAVDKALITLASKLRAQNVPPGKIYDLLLAAVLPPGRPNEVFLYPPTLNFDMVYVRSANGSLTQAPDTVIEGVLDRGLGKALVQVAVETHKEDDLRTRLKQRVGQALGELPAKILLAMLALQTHDDARILESLNALGERLKKDALQSTNSAIVGVLGSALREPKYAGVVVPLLDKASQNFVTSGNLQPAADIRFKLAEHFLQTKNEPAARAQFILLESEFAKVRNQGFDQHGMLAGEYLKIGWIEDAMRELALRADAPDIQVGGRVLYEAQGQMRGEPTLTTAGQFEKLAALLLRLPAATRYELLKTWSLPTASRKSIRYFVGASPRHVPSEQFIGRIVFPENRVMSTMLMLVEAAKESGKIEELKSAASSFAKDKIENADLLNVLICLVNGLDKDSESLVKSFAEAAQNRLKKKVELPGGVGRFEGENSMPAPIHASEYLVASLCLSDPRVSSLGEELLKTMQGAQPRTSADVELQTRIILLCNELKAKRDGAPKALEGALPPHWRPTTTGTGWLSQDGYVTAARAARVAPLLFDAPLTGTFEVNFEARPSAGGSAGYGGLLFHPGNSFVQSLVTGDYVQQEGIAGKQTEFGPMTIQVTPDKIRCLVNGKLFFEDIAPAPTSPWLMLSSDSSAIYRNATMSGNPVVPKEVRLTAGNYLEGWQAHVHGGTLPKRLAASRKGDDEYGQQQLRRPRRIINDDEGDELFADTVYDWVAREGELRGRKLDWSGEKTSPSCLAYFRPPLPGETLRYEFFYEPGKSQVHPSLGHLAFLLEPDGVKLHWMSEPGEDWLGLAADNAVTPTSATVSAKPPLKPAAWNSVVFGVTASGVRIELNGVVVYEAKVDREPDPVFGFFHYRNLTDARVRNVVLSGNWTQPLATNENLSLVAKSGTPAEVNVRRSLLGESIFTAEAGELVARSRKLPARERYLELADWVLPNQHRQSFQLAGVLRPLDVLGVVDQKQQPPGRRILQGGRLDLPGLELILAAKESHNLEELCGRLTQPGAQAETALSRRSKLALLAAALAAKGDDQGAGKALRELLPDLAKLPPDAPASDRWPDLVALLGTSERPALLEPVTALLDAANKNLESTLSRDKTFEGHDWWLHAFRDVRARLQLQRLSDGQQKFARSESPFIHWEPATVTSLGQTIVDNARHTSRYIEPMGFAHGAGVPRWALREGAVVHFPGHGEDFLIFDTPLRGNFEASCELKLGGWEEMYLRYGSREFALQPDRKNYRLHTTVQGVQTDSTVKPPLPASKEKTYQFRLAVKDAVLRAYIDGREVLTEKIGPNPDPWLMLHCSYLNTGVMRNLKISGSPTVPQQIDLIASDELGAWHSEPGHYWIKRGEEMFSQGPSKDLSSIRFRQRSRANFTESATHYLRPMSEDGAVEYEFFYDLDKSHVHPMLDRLTFLLEPEGVKLHWLTDGSQEKSKIPYDNSIEEPSCRRGPSRLELKPRTWNKVRLSVAGDNVKIALNGTEIYERPIESTNQRQFGFFHFTDRTEARVRSVQYSGAWPKQFSTKTDLFEVKK